MPAQTTNRRHNPGIQPAGETSPSPHASGELPSREALTSRLEAQRAELLRAMSNVDLARRTIEQHRAFPAFGSPGVNPEEHEIHRQRVLAALSEAGDALGTAYPMLERIADGLTVEEILKEHASAPPPEYTAREGAKGAADQTRLSGVSRKQRKTASHAS